MNASNNEVIFDMNDDMTINLTETGSQLNIIATIDGEVGSVRFSYDSDDNYQTENIAPYALAGDSNGNYNAWTPALGDHNIVARAYAGSGASGNLLDSINLNFTVVSNESDPIFPTHTGSGAITKNGEPKKWHKQTLSIDGPAYSENSADANPFLDFRLNVTFSNGETSYTVPGYFAADGRAGESSSDSGSVWRVHFTPDLEGLWTYECNFEFGNNIAVSNETGLPVDPIDGLSGNFNIEPNDKTGRDHRAQGRLNVVGERYLQFQESGQYFLKGGSDAPENLLAYEDFDNTPNHGNRRKSYSPHEVDYHAGDPSWQDGKGTELIGAINYLYSKGVNAISFLTMNIQGDDQNVFPYVEDTDFTRFDCSKLDQWEVIFTHADSLGFYLHFKTQETENDQLLDGGELGIQRKLYYRELIARFGHHLALNWNMGEENTQTDNQRKDMAAYFAENDPYGHHVVIHTYPNQTDKVYNELLGDQSLYSGISIQTNWSNVYSETSKWVKASNESGKIWVVANDEQGGANLGVPPDPGYPGYEGSNPDFNDIRKEVLWGNLMAGGAGVEYYFGYQQPESDLSLQDFRSRDKSWEFVNHALTFFNSIEFWEMQPNNDLVSDGWCMANPGEQYLIYLKNGGQTNIEFTDDSIYNTYWFNPRTGVLSEAREIAGPGIQEIGPPPTDPEQDWAILVEKVRTSSVVKLENIDLKIFPNPSHGIYRITGDLEKYQLALSDGVGKKIKQVQGQTLDIRNLPDGMYILAVKELKTGKKTSVKLLKKY
ncbi:hypothetical protein GCM10007940_06950 [Portibacter lacus]|uniref:DUF5060 domain-containing protein n=1 Tax=Portibacter lacus TaxID=1099794 RepID=A0AA37WEH7_9BACT|nr:hypothetical protein GCM10007940_06950 [Portibacter lacus]